MTPRFTLTARDQEILTALTWQVRLLSLAQIGRTWWATARDPVANARARLKQLAAAELVQFFTGMMRPEIPLTAPVLAWEVGDPDPPFAAASYHLMTRWQEALRATPCVIATQQAGLRFGGKGGRLPKAQEQTHDLHVAQMFLNYRRDYPALMPYWQSEEIFKRERGQVVGEKLPDAMLIAPTWTKVVEFGGEYPTEKLRAFHAYCAAKNWPYEVW